MIIADLDGNNSTITNTRKKTEDLTQLLHEKCDDDPDILFLPSSSQQQHLPSYIGLTTTYIDTQLPVPIGCTIRLVTWAFLQHVFYYLLWYTITSIPTMTWSILQYSFGSHPIPSSVAVVIFMVVLWGWNKRR